jgi:2-polyprenyl-6-methoxyphenol hydroxylase-like FAD-dependent oxidoreductase
VNKSGTHAVVLGAGVAGLLAARVLSEFYQTVTLVERDRLADTPVQRKGIPQGRHLHSLLSRGSLALDELFPGLLGELVAAGANVLDDGDLSRVYIRFGRYGFNRSEKFTDPAALVQYLPSRPFLEFHIRNRVHALGNVRFLDNHDVVEPIASSSAQITGVRVVNRGTRDDTTLHADLVVDAMGRTARTPGFLENLGYGRPAEQRSAAHATYYSQLVSIPPGMIAEKLVLAFAGKELAAGGLVAYEHNTWILTVTHLGAAGEPPTDFAGMRALAEQFTPPSMVAGLRSAEPLGDVAVGRYAGDVWRRYDHMPRFPAGLLVIGDALCTLNPVWGQGMTMATLEALALRDCLLGGNADVAQRFFRAAAHHIGPTWAFNQARERTPSPVRSRRSMSRRLANWTMNKAFKAAENDIVLTERFARVNNLIDPPTRLQDPALMARAILGDLRRAGRPD